MIRILTARVVLILLIESAASLGGRIPSAVPVAFGGATPQPLDHLGRPSINANYTDMCHQSLQRSASRQWTAFSDRFPLVPSAWDESFVQSTFLPRDWQSLRSWFQTNRASLEVELQRLGEQSVHRLFSGLISDGMHASTIAFDFSLLQHIRHPLQPYNLMHNRDVSQALALLAFNVDSTNIARMIWEADQPVRIDNCAPPTGLSEHLQQLHRQGYTLVDDFGLDVAQLNRQAWDALRRESHSDTRKPVISHATLPALEPLLHNISIARMVRGYLGGSARFDGHVILHIPAGVAAKQYASVDWHHDRCGRRLKLFVFLHDVNRSSHPTMVANGTHNLMYYSYKAGKEGAAARFQEQFVRQSFGEPVPMVGKAGGGFIFDTNAIHKGELTGTLSRTAVVLEFHGHGKLQGILRAGLTNPCPSHRTGKNQRTVKHGLGGLQLYPQEREPYSTRADLRSVKHGLGGLQLYPQEREPYSTRADLRSVKHGLGGLRVYPQERRVHRCKWQHDNAQCSCVSQPCKGRASIDGCTTPTTCVPIEALHETDWRQAANVADNVGKSAPLDIAYKLEVVGTRSLLATTRLLYIDAGAKDYSSSIGMWFLRRYPLAERFTIHAFEPETTYGHTYTPYPQVRLHHFAVWTENTTLSWSRKFAVAAQGVGPGTAQVTGSREAIDFADFLIRHATEADWVVVKMDVEGAEYTVVPHLIATKATRLIDEIFLEVHTDKNSCCQPPHDKGRHWNDAMRLVQNLRSAGVYAHEWG